MIRAILRRLRRDQSGFTLVEVVASVVILGIIMVPLGTAMVVGFNTVFGIQERLANVSDVQKLSTYFPQDVQSVDADGVNPATVDDEAICKSSVGERSLITFRWDADLGNGGQTVVRYIALGEGADSEIVRRECRADDPMVETVVAKHFGEKGTTPAAEYLMKDDVQTPVCFPRSCLLEIHGAYDYKLEAQRRVEGDGDNRLPPGQPTNVHAIGGNLRATVYWQDPPASALPIDYYVIEQAGTGVIGGANPTQFPASGAVINGLANFTSYTFRVQAHNLAGYGPWSDWSAPVTPGPTTADPPVLDSAAGDPTTAGRVTAAWSIPSPYNDGGAAVTGFRLYALSPDQTPTMAEYLSTSTRNGAVGGLNANTHYQVQVTAMNSFGESSPSVEHRDALTLPAKPATPTLAGSGGSPGVIKVNFTLPTDGNSADLLQVRARVGTSATQTPVDVATACPGTTPMTCTLTVSGVAVSSSTAVKVSVSNATGWGPDSDPLTVAADTTNPTAVVTFPNSAFESAGSWAAGCSAGAGICGTADDAPPGGVANVKVTVKRTDVSPNRYWNGSVGTSTSNGQPWASQTAVNLSATGTNAWYLAMTTGSLVNGATYTIVATATDSTGRTGASVAKNFTYTTSNGTTGSVTAPTNNQNISGTFTVKGSASAQSPLTVASAAFQYSPAGQDTWTTIGAPDTSSPYTVDWDTTTVTDGAYNVRVQVIDTAGTVFNSDGTAIVTRVDNQPPTGSITVPDDNAFVSGNAVTVSSNSADTGSGVASAQFQYKPSSGSTWTNIGTPDTTPDPSTGLYSVSWNTTTLTDGSYNLRVITTDKVGRTFTSPSITARVDNTKPVIDAPTIVGTLGSHGWYTSDVNVTWPPPTDPGSGIASTNGCGPTAITTNTQPAGQVLTCSAFDNAGNFNSRTVTIKRDATPPTGNLIAPPNGGTIGTSGIVRSDSDDDVSGVDTARFEYSPAGANTWNPIGSASSAPYQVTWSTTGLPLGAYDLRVITTDNAGLTFTSPVRTVTVDSTKPTVAISFPTNNGNYNAAGWNATCPVGVCGTAADTAPGTVASVALTIQRSSDSRYWTGTAGTTGGNTSGQWQNAATNLPATGTNTWSQAFTTASLSDGVTYTVVARSTDAAANVSDPATAVFKYDTTNPTGTITAPTNNANVSGSVTVAASSADATSGVASAQIEYRVATTGPWTAIGTDTTAPYSVPWDTSGLPDGQYYLHVITTDNAGNTFTSGDTAVRVRVDNTNPTGSITAPLAGAIVRGSSVPVTSNSADTGSTVANATFQRSPIGANTWTQIGAPDTTSTYGVSWDTTAVSDGQYDLRVITTDMAGNQFTSPVVTVRVDNTGPTIGTPTVTGTLGTNGWYISDVTVTWPAPTDATGIASTTCNTPQSVTANTSPTGQVVSCTATDNAGNTTTSPVTIKRDAASPTGAITIPSNGATVTATQNVQSDSADGNSGVFNAKFEYSPAGANTWTQIGAADTSSPYQASWNTAGLTDGNYDLHVITTDNAGNSFTSAIRTVYVDRTAPTVAITFPANAQQGDDTWNSGCPVGTGAVCGTASDGLGTLASVTVTIRRSSDNRYWNGSAGTSTTQWPSTTVTAATTLAATGTSNWSRALTTASLQNNVAYTVSVFATDSADLDSTTVTRTFTYLTAAPTTALTAPTSGTSVQGSITVSGTATTTSPTTMVSGEFQYKPTAGSTWTSIVVDTVSPYTTSWDTTTVTDGSYDLRLIGTNSAGNSTASATRTVTVDNTAPTGNITAPTNGSYVKGTAQAVSSNSADTGSGVDDVTFQRSPAGSGTWTTIAVDSSGAPYTVSWNTTTLTDGSYDLRAITTDNVGRSFTSPTVTVTVDNTAPAVTPDVTGTLGLNSWYTSNVAVNWNVSDASGIATSTGCGTTNITTNTTGQVVTCQATDAAGNVTSTPITIKRDATAPTGTLTAPADGANLTGAVTVSSNSADANSGVLSATFQFSPAGDNNWTTIGAPDTTAGYSVSWNTAVLTGAYDLRVVTTDNAGSTFTSPTRTVAVDNTPPTVAITFPVDGAAYNATGWAAGCTTNDVCGTAADAGTVAGVSLTIRRSDGRYWTGNAGTTNTQWTTGSNTLTVNGTTAWNRVLTIASLSSGSSYTVTAIATDGVGLTGTTTSTFAYDTSAPTGVLTAPANNANVSGNVAVTSNSADAGGSGITAKFEYRVLTTGPWTLIGSVSNSPYTVTWDSTTVPDGQYYLRVTTTDNAGNTPAVSGDTAVRVRVDNTPPTGNLTAPLNGAFVKGTAVTVSSNSADSGTGVANVVFQRSPSGTGTWTTIATDSATPFTQSWNTTTLTDGSYDLRAVTTDVAGVSFASPIVTVKVDNNGPTIVGNATGTVGDNGWYTSNVGLSWTVTDTFGVASTSGCGTSNITTDTTGTDFTCNASDNAGNTNNGTVNIKRDTVNPTGALTAPTSGSTVRAGITVSSSSADATSGVASATFQRSPAGANNWTTIATDASTPFTQTWTTTGVSDGSYDLQVVTTDNAGNTFTSPMVTITVDNSDPIPTTALLSGPGGAAGNGLINAGDQMKIIYSDALKVSTICTNWTGDTTVQNSTNVTVTLNDSGSSDTLSFAGTVCSNIGTIDTNRNYTSNNRTFTNSTVNWNPTTKTLLVTLGTLSGSVSTTTQAATAPTYTPSNNFMQNLAGATVDNTGFTPSNPATGSTSRF